MHFPNCDSPYIVKKGIRNNDEHNYRCQSYGRQFVENPSGHYHIDDEARCRVDRLLGTTLPGGDCTCRAGLKEFGAEICQ